MTGVDVALAERPGRTTFVSIHSVVEPEHVNLEEAKAMLLFVKLVLRSTQRCPHGVGLLIGGKGIAGAVCRE